MTTNYYHRWKETFHDCGYSGSKSEIPFRELSDSRFDSKTAREEGQPFPFQHPDSAGSCARSVSRSAFARANDSRTARRCICVRNHNRATLATTAK